VHPRAKLASDWWEAQQAPGAEQILADANEKTELLVALSEFEAIVGWRPLGEAISILSGIPGARDAVTLLTIGDRPSAIRSLLALDNRTESVSLLPVAAKAAGLAPADCAAFERVVRVYPGDRGALLTALLAHVTLSPGSAVFVPAGVPHSYIHGLGLEVMTTSDNVLRLGLTPKPIFVSEALDALDDTAVPQVLHLEVGEAIRPVGAPFEVRLVGARSARNDADAQGSTDEGSAIGQSRGPRSSDSRDSAATGVLPTGQFRLCLAIEGSATVTTDDGTVTFARGTAAVLAAAEPTATVSTTGLVALVSDRGASL
jgi:mannose-6-phosphate isomerase